MLDPNSKEFTYAREGEFLDIIGFDLILSFKVDDTRNARHKDNSKYYCLAPLDLLSGCYVLSTGPSTAI